MKQLSISTMRGVLGPLASDASGLGEPELGELIHAIAQHGRRCVRPRAALALSDLPFETEPVPWSTRGRFLADSRIRPGNHLHYAAGNYAIQDAASLLPITLMQLQPGQIVCDVCAAPGGKSLSILDALDGQGLLLSNEVIASRVDTLQLTLGRSGYANYLVANRPAEQLADVSGQAFDCVLVDAPCTGQSMIARGKQSLSAFSQAQIAHSAARQQSILRAAIQMVRPGGRIVYSTCTFAFEENEGIVAWLRGLLPEWQPLVIDQLAAWQTPGFDGCYRLWPHRDRCAGGFAAALLRPLDDDAEATAAALSQSHSNASSRERIERRSISRRKAFSISSSFGDSSDWTRWHDWLVVEQWGQIDRESLMWKSSSAEPEFWLRRQRAHWFDSHVPDTWRRLAHAGIEVAASFGEQWQPSYSLATLERPAAWFEPLRRVELSDAEAIQFMSGASLHRAGTAGWCVAHWRGRPLGWGKQVASQLKNHLPKPLRQPSLSA